MADRADLASRIIRHTPRDVLAQDPLRAYRALHFAARFNFTIHPSTLASISQTDLSQVKPERIYLELKKLLLLVGSTLDRSALHANHRDLGAHASSAVCLDLLPARAGQSS